MAASIPITSIPSSAAPSVALTSRAVATLFAITSVSAALTGCESSAAPVDARTSDQLVQIAVVEPAGVGEQAFNGVVSARVQSNLGFRVAGKVVERLVDAGQIVRKGQPLMRLDPTDYQHAISAQTGNVDAARARMVQTAADEERYRQLVDSGAVSRADYDQAKAAADAAKALFSAAQAQLSVASDTSEYATLVADADGTVVDTTAEPGQYVAAGQIVIQVARAGSREATVNLPETVRPTIGSHAQVNLYGREVSTERSDARLRQLSDSADPVTRTFEARYVLEGDAAKAPLGATVTVRLAASGSSDLAVPLGAINDQGNGPGVWTYDAAGSTVAFQPVRFLRFDGERAIVAGELKTGDAVVAMGGHLLHATQRVRVSTATVASK